MAIRKWFLFFLRNRYLIFLAITQRSCPRLRFCHHKNSLYLLLKQNVSPFPKYDQQSPSTDNMKSCFVVNKGDMCLLIKFYVLLQYKSHFCCLPFLPKKNISDFPNKLREKSFEREKNKNGFQYNSF